METSLCQVYMELYHKSIAICLSVSFSVYLACVLVLAISHIWYLLISDTSFLWISFFQPSLTLESVVLKLWCISESSGEVGKNGGLGDI